MAELQEILQFFYSMGGIAFALFAVHIPAIKRQDMTERQIRQSRGVLFWHGLLTYVYFIGSILKNQGVHKLNQGIPYCIMAGAFLAAFFCREKRGKMLFYDALIFSADTLVRKSIYFVLQIDWKSDDSIMNHSGVFAQLQSIYFLFWVVVYFLICRMEKNQSIKNFTGNRISCAGCIGWIFGLTLILGMLKTTGMVLFFQGAVCLGAVLMFGLQVLIDNLEYEKEKSLYQKETQGEMKYYENVERNQQEVYRLYHDMKNHLLSLQAQTTEDAQEYVRYCMQQMEGMESHADTGETYLDVLLQDKWRCAKEQNVAMHFFIEKDCFDGIGHFDLTAILGNALDNAIEAAGKVTDRAAEIVVKAGRRGNCIVLKVINDYEVEPEMHQGVLRTAKKNQKYHGYGMKNMRIALERYQGEYGVEYEDKKFTLWVNLYCRKK